MDAGDLLTRWTIRLALALYAASLTLRVVGDGRRSWLGAARLAWTGGYMAFLLHVACAFQFYHQWSHDAAYEATARQTAEVVGLAWGGGLYVNYAVALVWGMDVCWWWLRPARYQARSWGVEGAVQGFLAFIAFQATVVFGMGAIRWAGVAGSLYLAGVLAYAVHRRRQLRRSA